MKTIALALGLLVLAGCNNHTSNTGREPDEYLGCGTDESWRTFADLEPMAMVDDARAPLITAPAAGATVPLAQPVHLTWQQDANDVGAPAGDVTCTPAASVAGPGALSPLHEPPISGNVYDLQLTVDGSVAWRVITTLQQW